MDHPCCSLPKWYIADLSRTLGSVCLKRKTRRRRNLQIAIPTMPTAKKEAKRVKRMYYANSWVKTKHKRKQASKWLMSLVGAERAHNHVKRCWNTYLLGHVFFQDRTARSRKERPPFYGNAGSSCLFNSLTTGSSSTSCWPRTFPTSHCKPPHGSAFPALFIYIKGSPSATSRFGIRLKLKQPVRPVRRRPSGHIPWSDSHDNHSKSLHLKLSTRLFMYFYVTFIFRYPNSRLYQPFRITPIKMNEIVSGYTSRLLRICSKKCCCASPRSSCRAPMITMT